MGDPLDFNGKNAVLGPIDQIGYVVNDPEQSIESWLKNLDMRSRICIQQRLSRGGLSKLGLFGVSPRLHRSTAPRVRHLSLVPMHLAELWIGETGLTQEFSVIYNAPDGAPRAFRVVGILTFG